MTLGSVLSDTIKEEQAFSKVAATRYAEHNGGKEGVAEVEAFEKEIEAIQVALANRINAHVPSSEVQVALKGEAFKVFESLSSRIIRPNDAQARGAPMECLARNAMYAFGARALREWAQREALELVWKPRSNETECWWTVHASPLASRAR